MFCRYCGKEIPDAASFCTYCGRSQTVEKINIQDSKLEEQKKVCYDNIKDDTQEKAVSEKNRGKSIKCPKCGSNNIQFATRTHGSLFSTSDSCCGFLLLGPLGLLCGLCGSDVSTDEFWVCRDCGKKFTEADVKAKEKEERDAFNVYQKQKEILSAVGNKSHDEIEADVAKTQAEHSAAVESYQELLNKYANGDDPQLKKCAKIVKHDVWSAVAWLGLAVGGAVAFAGDSVISLFFAIICGIYLLIHSIRAKKAKKILAEADPGFSAKYQATQETAERMKAARNLHKASQSVEDYESKHEKKE